MDVVRTDGHRVQVGGEATPDGVVKSRGWEWKRDTAAIKAMTAIATWQARIQRRRRVTLFARSVILMVCEVLFNALLWIIAAIIFLRGPGDGHRILGLALVAWTTGLRHGLDADHISAIDNATRRIVSVPSSSGDGFRRPVTVGLFFSLGHSTIVVCTTVAIAISANVAHKLDGFGQVGGIIGASISSSFLILIGCINTVILYKTWRRLQAAKRAELNVQDDDDENGSKSDSRHFTGCMTRIAMPLLRSVDRPWKMYPVGVLFGLGFDTASSIALLSVATIAQQESGSGPSHSNANVVLLAFLFTAGMTLVDSADSCLMIWAYAPDLERRGRARFAMWEKHDEATASQADERKDTDAEKMANTIAAPAAIDVDDVGDGRRTSSTPCKENSDRQARDPTFVPDLATDASPPSVVRSLDASASRISLLLTLLSIVVAFCIGFIVLLGLIGDQCARCTAAADRQEQDSGGGLEGRWWLTWRRANDNSGYVGAGIVGAFAICVTTWFALRAVRKRVPRQRP